jgi:hypothetical protein
MSWMIDEKKVAKGNGAGVEYTSVCLYYESVIEKAGTK